MLLERRIDPRPSFSRITQNQGTDRIENIKAIRRTKRDYEALLKKFELNTISIFELSTLKTVTAKIKENRERGEESLYKEQRLIYEQPKRHIRKSLLFLLKSIIICYEKQ